MKTHLHNSLLFLGLLGIFIATWWLAVPERPGPAYLLQDHPPEARTPRYGEFWVTGHQTEETHSANIVLVRDQPIAVWYGGTEEGHRDVAIFISRFNGSEWSAPEEIIDRAGAEAGLGRYIRKVGNPALHAWPDGSLGLYFVTVSVGGWAASSVNYMESADLGRTWGEPRRLVTSPFINLSTLVRTHAVTLADGSISLPVYHEFMGKFAETLRLDRNQAVLDKTRLSRGKHSLQPAVLPMDENNGEAFLRYAGNKAPRLLTTMTHDGGRHWTKPEVTPLPNPDAAISVLRIDASTDLLALNDTEDGRHRLSLALRRGGGDWRIMKVIEEETPSEPGSHEFEFSYPSLAMTDDGTLHMVYTWNQKRIRHLVFNRAWLESTDG